MDLIKEPLFILTKLFGDRDKRRPALPDQEYDAVVVGSGPNGLAAAITIAREKRSVLLLEAGETIGGGIRTKETDPAGFPP